MSNSDSTASPTPFPPANYSANLLAIWSPSRSNLDGPGEYEQVLSIAIGPYRWALLANALFVICTFPLVFFLILRRSPKELSECIRAVLFISALICAIQAIWHAITEHVPLFPCFVGFSVGLFSDARFAFVNGITAITLQIITPTILTLNYTFVFIHYYALINAAWRFGPLFSRINPKLCALYILAFLINFSIVYWLVSTMILDQDLMVDYVKSLPNVTFQAITQSKQTSLLGLATLDRSFWIAESIFYIWIGGQAVLIIWLNVCIIIHMKRMIAESRVTTKMFKTRSSPSAGALRMLRIAYGMFLAKTVLLLVFFFVPFAILNLSISDTIHSYYPSILSFALISVYSSVVYCQIMFLVKPYRRWIFAHLICCFPHNQMVSSSKAGAISTTAIVIRRQSNKIGDFGIVTSSRRANSIQNNPIVVPIPIEPNPHR